MMRIVIAIVLILHGLVHVLGFVTSWRLATIDGLPYTTTLLSGRVDIGEAGARVMGLLWLASAVGFVVAGIALLTMFPLWQAVTLWVTLFSLAITFLGLPSSAFGVFVNILLAAYLLFGDKLSWIPRFG